jgi:hypothetical protein
LSACAVISPGIAFLSSWSRMLPELKDEEVSSLGVLPIFFPRFSASSHFGILLRPSPRAMGDEVDVGVLLRKKSPERRLSILSKLADLKGYSNRWRRFEK